MLLLFQQHGIHWVRLSVRPDGKAGTVAAAPEGLGQGVFYWAPEWIAGAEGDRPDWSRTWENRALFDPSGNMLPGLQTFEVQG